MQLQLAMVCMQWFKIIRCGRSFLSSISTQAIANITKRERPTTVFHSQMRVKDNDFGKLYGDNVSTTLCLSCKQDKFQNSNCTNAILNVKLCLASGAI